MRQRRQAWAAASLRKGVRRVVKAERSGLLPVHARSLNHCRGMSWCKYLKGRWKWGLRAHGAAGETQTLRNTWAGAGDLKSEKGSPWDVMLGGQRTKGGREGAWREADSLAEAMSRGSREQLSEWGC